MGPSIKWQLEELLETRLPVYSFNKKGCPKKDEQGNFIGFIEIDADDYQRCSTKNWTHSQNNYIWCRHNSKNVYIQHFIMGRPPKGLEIDHADSDTYNNKKSNLRFVTRSQNLRNRKTNRGKVNFIGVTLTASKNYRAYIRNGRALYLGTYKTPEEAAWAYNYACELLGLTEYAVLNKIELDNTKHIRKKVISQLEKFNSGRETNEC